MFPNSSVVQNPEINPRNLTTAMFNTSAGLPGSHRPLGTILLIKLMNNPLRITWLLMICFGCITGAFAADDGWRPLWDGHSFEGWKKVGKGRWSIEGGVVVGRNGASQREYGHLIGLETFGDFTVRLKFKAVRGNSGFYFRSEESGFSGVAGLQVEIDAKRDVGGLYETAGRSWVVKPTEEDVIQWFKPGEWNEMTVSAQGGHVVVRVNGHLTAEVHDDPGRHTGHFALQLHGGQDCEVWFKDLEIRTRQLVAD